MAIRKHLHDVLALTAELGHNNVNEDIRHTLIIHRMGLPEHETHRYIHELESLGLIRIQPRMNQAVDQKGREFRLINMTREGRRKYHRTKLLDKLTSWSEIEHDRNYKTATESPKTPISLDDSR
jgi:predicted transcriptional regulator